MHDTAPFACQHLTHLEFVGNYQCDEGYQINREYSPHLLFVIGSGNLRFEIKNDRFVAHAGAIV